MIKKKLMASVLSLTVLLACATNTIFAEEIRDVEETVSEESADAGITGMDKAAIQETAKKIHASSSSVLDESDIIYMVLTDRFYDGDSSNNGTLGKEKAAKR